MKEGYVADVQACAIGRASKTVREFLEKNYTENLERADTIKLAVKSLLEVVQTGAKNIEISVMERYGVVRVSLIRCCRRRLLGTGGGGRRRMPSLAQARGAVCRSQRSSRSGHAPIVLGMAASRLSCRARHVDASCQ